VAAKKRRKPGMTKRTEAMINGVTANIRRPPASFVNANIPFIIEE
jgi:hypothetical protein